MFGRTGRLIPLLLALLAGCQTLPEQDDSALTENRPRSILVLPPINESLDAGASYSYMTTVTRPLAERGYYVFPIAIVDVMMRDNGLPDPFEMHAVPLDKLAEVFDPDAVLYIVIREFGQKFVLLSSNTVVSATATLVDADTGIELWHGEVEHVHGDGFNSDDDVAEALLGALISQIVSTRTDQPHNAARYANQILFDDLLPGPRHPEFETQ